MAKKLILASLGLAGLLGLGISCNENKTEQTTTVNMPKEYGKVIEIKNDEGIEKFINDSEIAVVGFGRVKTGNTPSKAIEYDSYAQEFKNVPFLFVDIPENPKTAQKHEAGPGLNIYVYVQGKKMPDSEFYARYAPVGSGLEFYVYNYLKTKKTEFVYQDFYNFCKDKRMKSE